MSNPYRNGAFALGLVVGTGLSLNLFLWLDHQKVATTYSQATNQRNDNLSQIGQFWDELLDTFVSPSDTLAQWIMAILTIFAVLLLWATLRQTNRTNAAALKASEAATEANRLMVADQRPWLSFEIKSWREAQVVRHPVCIGVDINTEAVIHNHGRGIAHNVRLTFEITESRSFEDGGRGQKIAEEQHKSSLKTGKAIFPGESQCVSGGNFCRLDIDRKVSQGEGKITWWLFAVLYYTANGQMYYTRKFYSVEPVVDSSDDTWISVVAELDPELVGWSEKYI